MSKNVGKIFEEDFFKSIPQDVFCHRLKDTAQSYNESGNTKFAWENPYDYIVFDGDILYCLELKSTCQRYMGFQVDQNDKSSKMIKWHQIQSLTDVSKYRNIIAGFMLNFRLDNGEQVLYFLDINNFNKMKENIGKKSFNIMDAILYGAIKINGVKKRTRFRWCVNEFFEHQSKMNNK